MRKLLLGDIRKELAKEEVGENAAKTAKEAELAGGATGKALGKEGSDGESGLEAEAEEDKCLHQLREDCTE
jgi:hypothetical protein